MDLRAMGLLVTGLVATFCAMPVAAETTRYGAIVHDDALAHVLTLDREITRATLRDFETALEAHQPSLLVLDSPGGRINASLAVARAVREAGLDTVVPQGAECASACAFLFIAGTRREARGRLGVHQFTSDLDRSEPINATEADTQDTVADILATLSAFDAPAEMFVAMFATPNHSMHWFTRAELSDSGLTTGDRFDNDLNAWSKLRLASRDRDRDRDEASDPADASHGCRGPARPRCTPRRGTVVRLRHGNRRDRPACLRRRTAGDAGPGAGGAGRPPGPADDADECGKVPAGTPGLVNGARRLRRRCAVPGTGLFLPVEKARILTRHTGRLRAGQPDIRLAPAARAR